jgi:predicted chitinase
MITASQIKAILPAANIVRVATLEPFFQTYMSEFHIDTPARIGGFLSQVGEESDNLHSFLEYETGAEYEGSLKLGNTEAGDGVKFKGRGPIQITGRYIYKACSLALYGDDRLLHHPELLEQYGDGVKSACWFWDKVKDLNNVCDLPETYIHPGPHQYTKFQWITVSINGGLNGYATRLANYNRAKQILKF